MRIPGLSAIMVVHNFYPGPLDFLAHEWFEIFGYLAVETRVVWQKYLASIIGFSKLISRDTARLSRMSLDGRPWSHRGLTTKNFDIVEFE